MPIYVLSNGVVSCTSQVGSRLIEILLQTAYIQPPADQIDDCPPDIRPAFVHSLRTVMIEGT